jgi:hypothetical protein
MSISLNPEDASSGLPIDIVVTVNKSRFLIREGTSADTGESFSSVNLQWEMEDESGVPFVQWYSVGSPERLSISEDGKKLEPVEGTMKISRRSRCYALLDATVKAGFPANRVGDDASVFDGMVCEMVALDWKSSMSTNQIPVPGKILKLPGESGSTTASSNGTTGEDVKEAVMELLVESIVGNDGKISRSKLANLATAKKLGTAAPKYIFSAEFEADAGGAGYTFKGTTITQES